MSSVQSTPLKKKKSLFQKIKTFFDDIPDSQVAFINEASFKRPPQLKKSCSAGQGPTKQGGINGNNKYHAELFEEIHEFNHVELGE